MKRASLSALPARARPEPADLTDRLLDREALTAPTTPAGPAPEAPPPPTPKRAPRKRARPVEAAAPPAANSETAADPSIEQALSQAAGAAQALRLAARTAPARYELALRYRLEALAHHVQQVAEFLNGRTQR